MTPVRTRRRASETARCCSSAMLARAMTDSTRSLWAESSGVSAPTASTPPRRPLWPIVCSVAARGSVMRTLAGFDLRSSIRDCSWTAESTDAGTSAIPGRLSGLPAASKSATHVPSRDERVRRIARSPSWRTAALASARCDSSVHDSLALRSAASASATCRMMPMNGVVPGTSMSGISWRSQAAASSAGTAAWMTSIANPKPATPRCWSRKQ